MTIQAGKLRQRLLLQQSTTPAVNTFGEQAPAWVTVATLHADVTVLGGTEPTAAGQTTRIFTGTAKHRYWPGLDSTFRYVWGVMQTGVAGAIARGVQTVTPASMTGINAGDLMLVDQGGAAELVTVTAVTATTFSAAFVSSHLAGAAVWQGAVLNPTLVLPDGNRREQLVTWTSRDNLN